MESPQGFHGECFGPVQIHKSAHEPRHTEQPGHYRVCDDINPNVPPGSVLYGMTAAADGHNKARVEMWHVGSKP